MIYSAPSGLRLYLPLIHGLHPLSSVDIIHGYSGVATSWQIVLASDSFQCYGKNIISLNQLWKEKVIYENGFLLKFC